MSAAAMTAVELLARLRRHYLKPGPLPGGIFVDEVGTNDGNAAGRRCDAIYVGFTGTSGRMLVGHELKVSRADWRNELDKPAKADFWADQCHAWYMVAPSTDVVLPNELPPGWGLLVVNPRTRTRLDVAVRAQHHPERTPSWQVVRSVMARYDTLRAEAIAADISRAEAALGQELLDARSALRRVKHGVTDEAVELTRAILSDTQTRLRANGVGSYVDRDVAVQTLVDLVGARAIVRQLEGRTLSLARALRDLQAELSPMAEQYLARLEDATAHLT